MPKIYSPPLISVATASGTGTNGFNVNTTQQGWLINGTTSATVSIGDVYSANGNNYSMLAALSAFTGQAILVSGSASLGAATTLTKVSGNAGSSATITITNSGTNPLNPLATYLWKPQSTFSYLEIEAVGGGGGGAGAGASAATGVAGTMTLIGTLLFGLGGGSAGAQNNGGIGGIINTTTPWLGSAFGANIIQSLNGGGGSAMSTPNSTQCGGGVGGSSPFGGAGASQDTGGVAGMNAATGSGSGGGGAGFSINQPGGGGGSGAYIRVTIPASLVPAAGLLYTIGTGGLGGVGASVNGGAGASGKIIISEY